MINGDYNMFINDLYNGEEYNFSYKDRQYFVQSWYDSDKDTYWLGLSRLVPLLKPYLFEYSSNISMNECVKEFLKAKLFDGKTFAEIESEAEWLDSEPDDLEEATKEYWEKHPNEISDGIK